jgi:pantoate--beta-alanine ligase
VIIVESIPELRGQLARARAAQQRIGFVPTMGYLHEGHLSLVDIGRRRTDYMVASVVVNPLQFGPTEDLDRYPRDLERDGALLQERGVDLLFTPPTDAVYPAGAPATRVSAPSLSDRLDGHYRPGHFEGVLTVVAKLFNLVQPQVAVFGQKDLQQAALVRRMVRDLDYDIDIVIAPIVREPDGLAMSSRNAYLDAGERTAARALNRALHAVQAAFTNGTHDAASLIAAARAILDREPAVRTQYIELVDPDTLEPRPNAQRGAAIAVAAFVGATRLIDNHLLD